MNSTFLRLPEGLVHGEMATSFAQQQESKMFSDYCIKIWVKITLVYAIGTCNLQIHIRNYKYH
jgi:hypothetical protein